MGYIGNQTTNNFTSLVKQSITGTGGTAYTLDHSVANQQEIEVFVNNVRQEPGVAYTVSGTALTMTGNVLSTDDFYVIFQGKAIGTATPPANSITTDMFAAGANAKYLGDAGADDGNIIRVHQKELNTSVTVPTDTNALCAGPLTLASGVTITVNSGSTLVIA
jgi:hypothetical protein